MYQSVVSICFSFMIEFEQIFWKLFIYFVHFPMDLGVFLYHFDITHVCANTYNPLGYKLQKFIPNLSFLFTLLLFFFLPKCKKFVFVNTSPYCIWVLNHISESLLNFQFLEEFTFMDLAFCLRGTMTDKIRHKILEDEMCYGEKLSREWGKDPHIQWGGGGWELRWRQGEGRTLRRHTGKHMYKDWVRVARDRRRTGSETAWRPSEELWERRWEARFQDHKNIKSA